MCLFFLTDFAMGATLKCDLLLIISRTTRSIKGFYVLVVYPLVSTVSVSTSWTYDVKP